MRFKGFFLIALFFSKTLLASLVFSLGARHQVTARHLRLIPSFNNIGS